MLSNLTSCHGVFIPTTFDNAASGSGSGGSGGSGSGSGGSGGGCAFGNSGISISTRHYRSYYHNHGHSTHNETKRNKRTLSGVRDRSIWEKIEEDFTPELVEEQSKYNIPETVHQSPKQTSTRMMTTTTEEEESTADDAAPDAAVATIPAKKLSALFIKPETDVECLYRKSGIREKCEVCASDVVLTDDGFLTCKNPACSILYKDESLDQSAEWRYYGADDNQNSDPTRCGMPVNPLLKESSYGCKVMCEGGSYSQDMMKIRRYTEWQ